MFDIKKRKEKRRKKKEKKRKRKKKGRKKEKRDNNTLEVPSDGRAIVLAQGRERGSTNSRRDRRERAGRKNRPDS